MARALFRALGVMLTALVLLPGCGMWDWLKANDPPIAEPPCDGNNPYQCGDGSCCNSGEPKCWGPDSVGYYCEPPDYNPDDPAHLYSSKPRHYARKRGT